MVNQILKDLQKTWGLTFEELDNMREQIQEFGYSCYDLGYRDGIEQRSEDIKQYYDGFSYGKKSDNE